MTVSLPISKAKHLLNIIKKIERGGIKPSVFAKPLEAIVSATPGRQNSAIRLYRNLTAVSNNTNGASKALKRRALDAYTDFLRNSRLIKASSEVILTSDYLVNSLRKEAKAPEFVNYLSALFKGKPSAVRYALKLKAIAPGKFAPFVQNTAATKWFLTNSGRIPQSIAYTAKNSYKDLIQAKKVFQGAGRSATTINKLKETPVTNYAEYKNVVGKIKEYQGIPMVW